MSHHVCIGTGVKHPLTESEISRVFEVLIVQGLLESEAAVSGYEAGGGWHAMGNLRTPFLDVPVGECANRLRNGGEVYWTAKKTGLHFEVDIWPCSTAQSFGVVVGARDSDANALRRNPRGPREHCGGPEFVNELWRWQRGYVQRC